MDALRQVSSPMVLYPAYGRRYSRESNMRLDWEHGKDFALDSFGPYCSIRDVKALMAQASSITIRDPMTGVSIQIL